MSQQATDLAPLPASVMKLKLEWLSLPLLLLLWQIASMVAASRFLPSPVLVAQHVVDLALTGHLIEDFSARHCSGRPSALLWLWCWAGSLGFALGRVSALDRLFGPWVMVGLNMPAIVIAIICYIWLGLSEFALSSRLSSTRRRW